MEKNKKKDCCPKSGSNSANPFSKEKSGDKEKVIINPTNTGSEPGENEPDKNDPTRKEIPLPIFNVL